MSRTDPYSIQQAAIDRQRALAMALQQQSMQPLQPPPVRGAKISPLEGLSKIAQALLASYQNAGLDKQQTTLAQGEQNNRMAQAMGISQAAMPQPQGLIAPMAQPQEAQIPGENAVPAQAAPPTPMQLPVGPGQVQQRNDATSALAKALLSSDRTMQDVGKGMVSSLMTGSREQQNAATQFAHELALQANSQQFQQKQTLGSQAFERSQQGASQEFQGGQNQLTRENQFNIAALKEPATKSLQSKDMILKDGSRKILNLDPASGLYLEPGTGKDFSAQVAGEYHQPPAGSTGDARMDKSFQFNSTQLAALQKPVADLATRMGNLQTSIGQSTPQADALIAPELLSIVAGGQGSGLRMTESEIARIVGGRSKWESLKASANQWSLDPKTANSITPEQRAEIKALADAVAAKVSAKQDILDAAGQSLIDAKSVDDHRKAVANARKALGDIDSGRTATSGAVESALDKIFGPAPKKK